MSLLGGPLAMRTAALILAAALLPATAAPAATLSYAAALSGAAEAPPNGSLGTGASILYVDKAAHTLRVTFGFQNLEAGSTAIHIHAPTAAAGTGTAGVATAVPTFPGAPTGVASGDYDQLFDL